MARTAVNPVAPTPTLPLKGVVSQSLPFSWPPKPRPSASLVGVRSGWPQEALFQAPHPSTRGYLELVPERLSARRKA